MTLAGLRVLLAENNPTNQLVATQMLESLGASVIVAEDGAEALEIIDREPFDVMLVDIEMPRVSGIEVLQTVRRSPGARADMPMIALTAYVMREHRAAIDAAGADGVIAKPILSIEQFGADIRRFMRKRTGATKVGPAVVPQANEGGAPVIDRTAYDTLAETIGPAAMAELLGKVESDIGGARDRLARALDPIDMAEIRAVSHILISVAGAVGATRLQEGARRMNVAGHEDDAATILAEGPNVLQEIGRMFNFVQQQIDG